MENLFDQFDIEELLFEKLAEEFGTSFAEYIFNTWPEIIENVSKQTIYYGEKLIIHATQEILKIASRLKQLEMQKVYKENVTSGGTT